MLSTGAPATTGIIAIPNETMPTPAIIATMHRTGAAATRSPKNGILNSPLTAKTSITQTEYFTVKIQMV
jgi:hypothetical protein